MLDSKGGGMVERGFKILPAGATTSDSKRTHASHPSLLLSTGSRTPHRAKIVSFF